MAIQQQATVLAVSVWDLQEGNMKEATMAKSNN